MKYKLTCTDWNAGHVRFNLFDPTGANCGKLCVSALDMVNFLQNSWKGNIDWDGKMPEWLWNPTAWPAHAKRLEKYQLEPTHDHGEILPHLR